MKKLFLTLIAAVGIVACSSVPPGEETVIVPYEALREEANTDPAIGPPDAYAFSVPELKESGKLPDEMVSAVEAIFPDQEQLIVTTKKWVKEEYPASKIFYVDIPTIVNPETGEVERDKDTAVKQGIQVLGGLIPGSAAFMPLAYFLYGLFRRRSSQHWGNAVKALIPYDSKVDLGAAIKSADRALGGGHSNDSAEDLLKVTKKMAAKEGKVLQINGTGEVEVLDHVPAAKGK